MGRILLPAYKRVDISDRMGPRILCRIKFLAKRCVSVRGSWSTLIPANRILCFRSGGGPNESGEDDSYYIYVFSPPPGALFEIPFGEN